MFDTVEASVGEAFIGLGALVIACMATWVLYQLNRVLKNHADKEEKYNLFEEVTLDKVALKKGVDLEKELIKKSLFNKRTFRKEVEKEVLETMFGKEK